VGVAVVVSPPDWRTLLLYLPTILLVAAPSVMMTGIGLLIGLAVYYASGGGFSLAQPMLVLATIAITPALMSTFHSVCHSVLKPRWLNRVLGEAIGLVHMAGLDEWSTVHTVHHMCPDDNERDPHPPAGRGFRAFLSAYSSLIAAGFKLHVEQKHGQKGLDDLKRLGVAIKLRQLLLAVLWFLVLGPMAFVFFFTVNIVAKKLMYVWFNWATHVMRDGKPEIIDLDYGVYRLVNLLGFNVFYHRAHHKRPGLFIPRPAD